MVYLKWEQERKARQAYNTQITHWKPQHSMSWSAEDTKRVSKDTKRDPGRGPCSSLGPVSMLTPRSQGLDQESHQAADSLGQKNLVLTEWVTRLLRSVHTGAVTVTGTGKAVLGWTVGLALLAASDSKRTAWVRFPHISSSAGNNRAWAHGAVGCGLIAKGCRYLGHTARHLQAHSPSRGANRCVHATSFPSVKTHRALLL